MPSRRGGFDSRQVLRTRNSECGSENSSAFRDPNSEFGEATPSTATDPSRPCGVLARTPLCHGGRTSSILVRGAWKSARYANRQSDQAQTLESVGSIPTRATVRVGRRRDAGRSVKPPHAARQVRFLPDAFECGIRNSKRGTEFVPHSAFRDCRGPLVYRQDTAFSARQAGFDSPTDYSPGPAHGPATW